MTRSVPEWIGRSDNEAIPPRVKVRVFDAAKGHCVICTLPIRGSLKPAYDHIIAICNGGENRETNLSLLCVPCHKVKTFADVRTKATTYRKRLKHLGLKPKGRPMPGSRASGFKRKMDGTVERR